MIIPVVIFSIILNAFFGHMIFASNSQHMVSKYSVYVHFLSGWNSESKNIIFDVTNSWYKADKTSINHAFNSESIEYNSNQLKKSRLNELSKNNS